MPEQPQRYVGWQLLFALDYALIERFDERLLCLCLCWHERLCPQWVVR